jgi:hypothetical protein
MGGRWLYQGVGGAEGSGGDNGPCSDAADDLAADTAAAKQQHQAFTGTREMLRARQAAVCDPPADHELREPACLR